jgi:hypothetical protein
MSEPWTPGPWNLESAVPPGGWMIGNIELLIDVARARALADARLIAAAPEMAELLEAMVAQQYPPDGQEWDDPRPDSMGFRPAAAALLSRIRGEAEVSA